MLTVEFDVSNNSYSSDVNSLKTYFSKLLNGKWYRARIPSSSSHILLFPHLTLFNIANLCRKSSFLLFIYFCYALLYML